MRLIFVVAFVVIISYFYLCYYQIDCRFIWFTLTMCLFMNETFSLFFFSSKVNEDKDSNREFVVVDEVQWVLFLDCICI